MYDLGIRTADEQDYRALLTTHHEMIILVQLMDLDHNQTGGEIGAWMEDGQVTVDAYADITRMLDCDIFDPARALHMDSRSPSDGAMFADRLIQIRYAVIDPLGLKRYTAPVFTGQLAKFERSGTVVKVEAKGKEVFGLRRAWQDKTFKKGTRITSAMSWILKEMMGESDNRIHIPGKSKKLTRNYVVGGDKLPWKAVKELGGMVGLHCFYDGGGHFRARSLKGSPVFTFRESVITSDIDVGFDLDNLVNAVEVWGKKPKKEKGKPHKKRPHSRRVASRSSPLSPWALGRRGGSKAGFYSVEIEDEGIKTNHEADQRAGRELAHGLLESLDVGYDAFVVPTLEEMDVVRCSTSVFTENHRVGQFAIPLTCTEDMSVGYAKNVKPNKNRIRVKFKVSKAKQRNKPGHKPKHPVHHRHPKKGH